jgi:hypothetical protein
MQEKNLKIGKKILLQEKTKNLTKDGIFTGARSPYKIFFPLSPEVKNRLSMFKFQQKCRIVSDWKKLSFTEFFNHTCSLLLSNTIYYLNFLFLCCINKKKKLL